MPFGQRVRILGYLAAEAGVAAAAAEADVPSWKLDGIGAAGLEQRDGLEQALGAGKWNHLCFGAFCVIDLMNL